MQMSFAEKAKIAYAIGFLVFLSSSEALSGSTSHIFTSRELCPLIGLA